MLQTIQALIDDEKTPRVLRMGLQTVSGLAKQGFFIPYRYADSVAAAGSLPAYDSVDAVFHACRGDMESVLADIITCAKYLQDIPVDCPAPNPRWDQDWFPLLDAATAYSLVKTRKPRRIIETGSGHSTRFMAAAANHTGTEITCIDPAPRAALMDLDVTWHQDVIGPDHLPLFDGLEAGDICFIDSSHILMPGTDVDFLFNRVLPRLPAGVLVHIHDIFLPFDYPESWGWRGYNEQQAVMPMLTGGGWKPVFSSQWARANMADQIKDSILSGLHMKDGAMETSLWLEKTGPAIR